MSSQIYRSARSLLSYASRHKHLVPSKGRTAAAAAAAVSFKGTLPALASFTDSTNTSNKWIAGALALPAAAYMLQDQEAHALQMERTFIAIKPDGVQRGLISEIIERFERKGFKLVAIKLVVPSKTFAQKHYYDLKDRPFFNGLCNFLSSGPVLAMVWEGEGVITYGRKLIGATDPQKSEPGTIRGDLAIVVGRNIIHGSDGPETAKNEINLWFKPDELTNYTSNQEKWTYGEHFEARVKQLTTKLAMVNVPGSVISVSVVTLAVYLAVTTNKPLSFAPSHSITDNSNSLHCKKKNFSLRSIGESRIRKSIKMLEIMPINGVSWETTSLPLLTYGGSKNKSCRFRECTNTLSKRFEMPNSRPDALESVNGCKESLHLLKLHQGLDTCSNMKKLKQYHSQIIRLGLSGDNDAMGRVIKFCAISAYGDLGYALKVFSSLPQTDTFIYNIIFRGYLQFQLPKECISLYLQMLHSSVTPNKFTFPSVVRACTFDNAVEQGKQVHAQILKFGYHSDGYSQNNLIHMYVSFNSLEEAKRVLDTMPRQNVVSWTTLISGYSQSGLIDDARKLFDLMPEKNPASWNAMIAAYVQRNRFHEAFQLFDQMRRSSGFKLDKFVAASMLSACTRLGALKQGEWIHDNIKKNGIEVDQKLATTIVDMYCKCGSLEKAFETFNELPIKGISSWNCMIGGFAIHGKGEEAIELFKKMQNESKTPPDYITFVNLLSACAHSGLVKEGDYYFQHMVKAHNVTPGMEHYGCMVDLLGRAGMLNEAMKLINEMPMNPDVGVMGALAGACRIHRNIELGEKIGKKVIELEPHNSGRYVLLANIYATASKWEEVANIRKLMNNRGVKKSRGFSLIETGGAVYEFVAGGRSHPDSQEIYAKVKEMLACIRSIGYVPEAESVMHDITEEEEMEKALFYHSEKLAIAFGLMKTKAWETLRITKNLRVCKDCHEASKLISKFFDREIIVRDRSRFHHFKQGVCSCKDYW
ncbi:hypothetical protein SSX86_021959 [Deinandra increscens subsp. villosa]|uniref:nucleoside-diphosphate kinase n=1 Tax=Deinandra increscens subsp. villosa TaxID=3103831 RepID=A0AAP0GT34_9ASTR